MKSAKIKRHIQNKTNTIEDSLVVEQPLILNINGKKQFTLMCTPVDIEPLIIGFLFSESFIKNPNEIASIESTQAENALIYNISLPHLKTPESSSAVITSSSGSSCAHYVKKLFDQIKPVQEQLKIDFNLIPSIMETLQSKQKIFQQTGGTHAAGLFDQQGNIILSAEDLGRHNGLDKLIGKALMQDTHFTRYGLALSSRLSFEMVSKAARAGIGTVLAVSAPSSLAVEAAKHWKMFLCGFVREGRFNIYNES